MMKYIFLLAFVATYFGVSVYMSGANFDYKSASPEDRNHWLSQQAEDAKRQINKAIGRKYGYFSKTELVQLTVSGAARLSAILTVDNVKGGWASNSLKAELREAFCPAYNKLALAEHEVTIQFKMKNVEQRAIGNFSISPRVCRTATNRSAAS